MRFRLLTLLSVCLLVMSVLGCSASPQPAPEPSTATGPTPATGPSPRVRELLVEYRDTLLSAEQYGESMYNAEAMSYEALGELRLARLGAEFDLAETREERIQILTALLAGAREQEQVFAQQIQAELPSQLEMLQARAMRIKAELALEREKARRP
jgi:hypothetical protein